MANHHDTFFKAVFSRAEIAAGEFAAMLPPALVDAIDLQSARLLPGSFVDPELAERHSDLLYAVDVEGTEALIYVLFEHQSRVDSLMALRLLIYMSRAWDRWLREHPGAERIPAILPLVLYQGPEAWTAATEFSALIDLPAPLLADAGDCLPSFRFLLDDLSQHDDKALRQRPVSELGALALLLLRHARDQREALLAVIRSAADLLNALSDRDDSVLVISYILEVAEGAEEQIAEALRDRLGPEIQEAVLSIADQLREQGRLEGERRVLLRLLRRRFGDVSAEVEQRVSQASQDLLEAWTDRVLTATSLAEVFAE